MPHITRQDKTIQYNMTQHYTTQHNTTRHKKDKTTQHNEDAYLNSKTFYYSVQMPFSYPFELVFEPVNQHNM